MSKRWTCSRTRCANVTWQFSLLLYWPLVVLVAAHAPAAAKLEEHTQLVVRSNTHWPVAVAWRGGCSGGEGGESGSGGGEGGEGGEGGDGGSVGGEGGGLGGDSGGDGSPGQLQLEQSQPSLLERDAQFIDVR